MTELVRLVETREADARDQLHKLQAEQSAVCQSNDAAAAFTPGAPFCVFNLKATPCLIVVRIKLLYVSRRPFMQCQLHQAETLTLELKSSVNSPRTSVVGDFRQPTCISTTCK